MSDEKMTPNPEKPTNERVTGDEPATGPQTSYLQNLARDAAEEVPSGLTKASASELIERLQEKTGRTPQTPVDQTERNEADESPA
jgi:Protein of unknown function (DUF3072)